MNVLLKKIAAGLALLLVAVTPRAFAQPAASTPAPAPAPAAMPAATRDTLGVSPVKISQALVATAAQNGTSAGLNRLTQSLDSQLVAALDGTHKFQILARSDLDAVLREESLSNSSLTDDATAAKMFQLAGAKYLLVVTVNDYQDRLETANFSGVGEAAQRRHVAVSCVASIYATDSAKLLESVNIAADDTDVRNDPAYVQETGSAWAENLPVNLAGTTAEKIAHGVTDVLYPAKVVAKTGNQITLNRGDGTGIAIGQLWIIYHIGDEMFDPDTHESLGREEVPIGRAVITTVNPRTAIAELIEDHGVAVLDVARTVSAKSLPPGTASAPPATAQRREVSGPPDLAPLTPAAPAQP
jgi:hypothetical protein